MLSTTPLCLEASQRRPHAIVMLMVPLSTMPITASNACDDSSSVRARKFPAARGRQLRRGLLHDLYTPPADEHRRAKLQEALGHGAADSRAAARNQNSLALQQIVSKHKCPLRSELP